MARLLDLYAGAGGAAAGYAQAGFAVTGVDHLPQPRYPFALIQGDALEYAALHGHEYDVVHASPPWLRGRPSPLLIAQTLDLMRTLGVPYIVENVLGSKLQGVMLCGTMFALPFYRHRLFASNLGLLSPPHHGHRSVGGAAHGKGGLGKLAKAMGVPWMLREEIRQATPPAYTAFLGRQALALL